jgi:membrane-associated phospholipid phosphatase
VRVVASTRGSNSTARVLSIIGLPPVLAVPTALLAVSGQPAAAAAVAMLVIFGCILPIVLTVALFRAGRTFTFDLRDRSERALPSAATAVGCVATWGWLRLSDAPSPISAVVGRMHEPLGLTLALICLALGIGWARVHLGRHTLAQVAAGALTAAPIVLLT